MRVESPSEPHERDRWIALEGKPPEEEDLAPLLAKVEMLGPLSSESALWLARRTPQMRLESGQTVYSPRYAGTIVFALLEGRVRLYRTLGGAEITFEIIEAGRLFGDVQALTGRRRESYAEALLPSRVALLSTRVIRHLMRESSEVGLRMAEELSERLYEYQQRMLDVALKKVPARLASLLERLFETEGVVSREGVRIDTHYTHEQLATMIGSKRVAVSRAMGELRELGAVEVKGRLLYLRDEAALRWVAEEVGRREA
jgi:CRP/FNR family transcriptional regulator, cyclic AMP receptor protein